MLRVNNPVRNTAEFTQLRARLQRMAPAPTTEQVMKQGGAGGQRTGRDTGSGYPAGQVGRVEPPSGRYETFDGGNLFRLAVPDNWRELQGQNSVTFAPEGGYGEHRGQSVFTHGLQVGMEQINARNLRQATQQLIQGLAQSNPSIQQAGNFQNITISGRAGLAIVLNNQSDVTRQQERIALYTTQLQSSCSSWWASRRRAVQCVSEHRQSLSAVMQLNDGYRKLAVRTLARCN